MIDKLTADKIKEAASIVDVISDFITLKKKGVNYQCLCPFHADKKMGSFVVHPAMNVYKCFSCDAKGGPVEFLMNYEHLSYPDALRYLATKYSIPLDEEYDREKFAHIKPAKPRDITEIQDNLPKRTWPSEWIGYYTPMIDRDNVVKWLRTLPFDAAQRRNLEQALIDYHVGHTAFDTENKLTGERYHHEWTMWFMLDEKNILHNCHMMKYKPDGHRDKEDPYNQTWLHARMKHARQGRFDEEKESASYCLFGQHLLNAYPNAEVNIVESEKTAIIMAAAYGNHERQIWMACAGMHNLTRERLKGIMDAKRDIVLYPDRDGIQRWCKKANELQYKYLQVNTQAVKEWWLPEDGEKADIADVVLRMLKG